MISSTLAHDALRRLRPHLPALIPGLAAVTLMIDWAVQDGGYDPSTWYWGGLLIIIALGLVLARAPARRAQLSRPARLALVFFALYVAWSYLSIIWAQSPGDALQGGNRGLVYLMLFWLLLLLPWTRETVLTALLVFVIGVGALGFLFLARLANADHVGAIVVNGRLQAPTGYFNASVALFMMASLMSVALASRRTLPAPARGVLLGVAACGFQLAVAGESRGWLFTLPLVGLAAVAVVRDRIRFIIAAALPVLATVAVVHRLLSIYDARGSASALSHAASRAGGSALLTCVITIGVGTLVAAVDTLLPAPAWLIRRQRLVGVIVVVLVLIGGTVGTFAATHGHPASFIKRQWHGFSQPEQPSNSSSRFEVVGSGRYDFWRVALHAFSTHPIGGLGQDNFADYYVSRRRTTEEPAWTHSLEMRLLAMTGLVGTILFLAFLLTSCIAALQRGRVAGELGRWVAGVAMLPFVVWFIHGSVDWFWEMPCLTAPAFGFLAMACSLGAPHAPSVPAARVRTLAGRRLRPTPQWLLGGAGVAGLLTATALLGLPYLSIIEQSRAGLEGAKNPVAALSDYATASSLNPLSSAPGRDAGSLALQNGLYEVAQLRFRQAILREPAGWFGWLGAGLAASELGEVGRARHDFEVAQSINDQQPAVTTALTRVGTDHPLTAAQAIQMLIVVQ